MESKIVQVRNVHQAYFHHLLFWHNVWYQIRTTRKSVNIHSFAQVKYKTIFQSKCFKKLRMIWYSWFHIKHGVKMVDSKNRFDVHRAFFCSNHGWPYSEMDRNRHNNLDLWRNFGKGSGTPSQFFLKKELGLTGVRTRASRVAVHCPHHYTVLSAY